KLQVKALTINVLCQAPDANVRDSLVCDGNRCLFATRPSSEVSARNEEVAGLDFLVEFRVEPIHSIFCHLDRVVGASFESEWYDDICVHIVRPDPSSTPDDRRWKWEAHRYLLGSAICPSRAEAAA